jgi:hypothetical protein
MPTPPSLVAFGLTQSSTSPNVAVATPSLSWLIDDVVILFGGTPGATNGETFGAPSSSGSGIAFGAAQRLHDSTGTDCGGACWAAVATANSSGTFSTVANHDTGARQKLSAAYIFRGSAGIGLSAIEMSADRLVSLTPSGADGSICWLVMDWAAAATVAFSPTPTTHGAGSPGPTASPASAQVSPDMTYYVGELDDQTSAASADYGIGGAGTGPFTMIAIEAKAAAGPAGPPPPTTYAMLRPPVVAP